MAERKSVNKYYPPDWDPTKGSVNKHVGQHPLRDRAKKIKQGILVIRFEMPYNIWCGGCNAHIGMGVRYNAEKSKHGNYYSTPIYKFRMKCHLCDNYFEIQTDPQNHDYVILSGARRKEQRWDPKENGQIETEDKRTQKKMATDAMFKLEHGSNDQEKGKKSIMTLSQLEDRMDSYKDDYILNKIARNKFREEKETIREKLESDRALLAKSSLEIELVDENEEDKQIAGLIKYSVVESFDEKQKEKRKSLNNESIFSPPKISPNKFSHLIKKQYDPFNINSLNTEKDKSKPDLGIRRKSNSSVSETISDNSIPSECSERLKTSLWDSADKDSVILEVNRSDYSSNCGNTIQEQKNSSLQSDNRDLLAKSGLSVLMSNYSDSEGDT
ncbi:hypothetical protein LOTGIDRAFT_161207 [Lottia gigantea]|uniref:Coiled-coil domain-containing protein 130 n=1 Tax=Lottia gigantea TaxID=225164 RepID=V4ACE7_LOTGI|nr:hypothetical protein LOTGIDRAFT_161207 [Lottia gigantea]ESO94507.1 hypothetical protein LOTGIDRAFT_161207 [Lottia gigantea]